MDKIQKQKNGDGLPLTLEIGANVSMPSIHSSICHRHQGFSAPKKKRMLILVHDN